MNGIKRVYWIPLLMAALLAGCGGGSSSSSTGTAQISLTDAPSGEESFDNVLITVKEVWFHKSDAAGPGEAGWLKYPLPAPRTVDLAHLTDGAVSQILDQILPVGNYQQIRILLADTSENNYLSPYNNEVIVGGQTFPLRIPAPAQGIALVGRFQVTDGGTLRLAIDFDIGHDVVKVTRNGETEYILKPRLRYFDLDNAGAIRGQVDAATRSAGFYFVFKAEQKSADNTRYVVKRFTGIRADNTFLLSFLPPGTYDVLLRGRGVETVIVRGVPVVKGTVTDLGPAIAMPAGTEFTVNTTTNPTGSWVNFHQTLDTAVTGVPETPYEIRFRHVDPFTGSFHTPIALSNGPIHFGKYNSGNAISFRAVTPTEWAGGNAAFTAVADALLFQPTSFVPFDNTSAGPVFGGRMNVMAGTTPFTASGTISSFMGRPMRLDNNILFVVHKGLLVDAYRNLNVPMQMGSGIANAAYATQPLPGGFPGAFYGIDGLGWSASPPTFAVGIPGLADLRTGNDTSANFTMLKIF
jgi:hypothetical protein